MELKMELKILRRQAIVEIERYLKRNSSETANNSAQCGHPYSQGSESRGYEDGASPYIPTATDSTDEIMTQLTQTLRSQAGPHARYRSYFAATPTSTCSDIGFLRDPGSLPDAPAPSGIYLSPTSTQGSLPPLDEHIQRKHEMASRRQHYSSQSLGEIPEMRSSTMPHMFRMGRIDQYPSLASLPSYEEEHEEQEDPELSPDAGNQASSSSQSAGNQLEQFPGGAGIPSRNSEFQHLQASQGTWRSGGPPPADYHEWTVRSDSTLKHSLEFEQLREELVQEGRLPNMHTVADFGDVGIMEIMQARQALEHRQAGMPLPSGRLLLGNGMLAPSSVPPGLVAPAERSSGSSSGCGFANAYNANTGLGNSQAGDQSANPHLLQMASYHF